MSSAIARPSSFVMPLPTTIITLTLLQSLLWFVLLLVPTGCHKADQFCHCPSLIICDAISPTWVLFEHLGGLHCSTWGRPGLLYSKRI
jgi:hypothetical protein